MMWLVLFRFLFWFGIGAGFTYGILRRKNREAVFGSIIAGLVAGLGGIFVLLFVWIYLWYFMPARTPRIIP
ncbi:MAG: hypothetical protein GYB67_08965 [Chloroflexi bacterium]|nr:hypothetical protein [Chloroflexota bacterium]